MDGYNLQAFRVCSKTQWVGAGGVYDVSLPALCDPHFPCVTEKSAFSSCGDEKHFSIRNSNSPSNFSPMNGISAKSGSTWFLTVQCVCKDINTVVLKRKLFLVPRREASCPIFDYDCVSLHSGKIHRKFRGSEFRDNKIIFWWMCWLVFEHFRPQHTFFVIFTTFWSDVTKSCEEVFLNGLF